MTEKVLVDTTNPLPVDNEEDLVFLLTNGFDVKLEADIDLTATIDIAGSIVTLDLNGKTLKADWESDGVVEVIHVHNASYLTIVGDGNVISGGTYTAGTNSVISCRIDSMLTIQGGNYYSASYGDVIFCETNSIVRIEGGHFEAAENYKGTWYVLDIDESETTNRGQFVVTGGTFVNFDPANHTNDSDYTNKVADGYHSIYNAETSSYTVSAHSYNTVVIEPDCVNGGYTTYTCECGHSYVADETEALGHDYDAVVTDPTCTAGGYTTYTCANCGNEYVDDETNALGHTASAAFKENEVAAGCETAGSYDNVVYCSVCEAELSRNTITVDALGHTDGETVVENNVAADCENAGSYDNVVYCSVCNAELSRDTITVPATGHTDGETVVENNVAADCVNAGSYDNVVYCSVCGDELSRETITVDALGHTYVDHEAQEATCTEKGWEAYQTCENCDYTTYVEISANGHDEVEHEAQSPTCIAVGWDAYVTCNNCEYTTYVEKPATGEHNWVDNECTTDGCHANFREEKVTFELGANGTAGGENSNALSTSQTFEAGDYQLVIQSPTKVYDKCYDGLGNSCLKLGTSSAAGKFSFTVPKNITQVIIHVAKYKANTSKVKINGTTHTLTKNSTDGAYDIITVDTSSTKTVSVETVSGGYRAMVSSIIFVSSEVYNCEHQYEVTSTHNATCTESGSITSTCTNPVCNKTKVESINAIGHNYEADVTAPTCVDNGYTTYTCANCGDNYTTDSVPALDHLFGEWDVTPSTCTEKGKQTRECTRENCDYSETEEIAMLEHTYVNGTCICGASSHEHEYDSDCDAICNVDGCGFEREVEDHKFDNACDAICNVDGCGFEREVEDHKYTNNCDTDCNVCGTTREIEHTYSYDCDADCNVCGNTRTPAEHNYVDGYCECGEKDPNVSTTVTVSKSHKEITTLAGVSTSSTGGSLNGKNISLDENITITFNKGGSTSNPAYYTESIRMYQKGATLTIKAAEGCTIETILITVANNSAGKGPISVTGGTASALTNLVYTITVNENTSEVVITTTGTTSSTRLYVSNIEVQYKA